MASESFATATAKSRSFVNGERSEPIGQAADECPPQPEHVQVGDGAAKFLFNRRSHGALSTAGAALCQAGAVSQARTRLSISLRSAPGCSRRIRSR